MSFGGCEEDPLVTQRNFRKERSIPTGSGQVLRPYKQKRYERKRTDSRWNILMAMKRAAEA